MRPHARRQHVLVFPAEVCRLLDTSRDNASTRCGNSCSRNGRKTFCADGIRKSGPPPKDTAPASRAALARRSRCRGPSVMPGMMGLGNTPTRRPASLSLRTASSRSSGPRRPRFQHAREFFIQSCDGDVDAEDVPARHLAQQVHVANHEVGLGDDAEMPAALPRRTPRGWRGSARTGVRPAGRDRSQCRWRCVPCGSMRAEFLAEEVRAAGLGVDLVLEIFRRHLHELVGVAGIAVFTAELAATVGVDGPAEGHVGFGAVEDTDRAGISKYRTARFASSSGLSAAIRAMPTSAIPYFRLFFAHLASARLFGGYGAAQKCRRRYD